MESKNKILLNTCPFLNFIGGVLAGLIFSFFVAWAHKENLPLFQQNDYNSMWKYFPLFFVFFLPLYIRDLMKHGKKFFPSLVLMLGLIFSLHIGMKFFFQIF